MKRLIACLAVCLVTLCSMAQETFEVGNNTFMLNGQPFVVKAAELHYPRIPRPYWDHRIQMCKALGMNAVCLYVFWNIHEQQQGVFDFTGQNDVAEFCRLCKKNGMYVIVRPGPYVCAEWEMGGLPWWLLKKKDIRLREQDPFFMERVRLFEQKVGEQLAPLTIQHGGPIIMVQVENEYGSYGEDKAYIAEIRDCLRAIYGDKLTLFQCDWASNFELNGLDDLVWTMNFGTGANIDEQFRRLRELRPTSPLMCSEFWSGWFDKWTARHETRPADDMVAGIDEMLSKGISFSLYMTHGGTSFSHWAGANSPGFAPDVTSYDYDAPVNEYGLPTEKYHKLRRVMAKYTDGKSMPAIPKPAAPLISVPQFTFTEHAPIGHAISTTVESRSVQTFEQLDMGWGTAVYTTSLPEIASQSMLTVNDCHDFAQVFVNGTYIGQIDRIKNEKTIVIPATKQGDQLTILIEAMGRINFGRAIKDYKGITQNVTLSTVQSGHDVTYDLKNWTISLIPDDYATALRALSTAEDKQPTDRRGYYRAHFTLKKVGDTFLNLESFGKGQAYVNGHAIGRFWNIGPQQTLYVPGCWLKKGVNEVVVLDIVGPKDTPTAFCQNRPELDKLHLQQSNRHNNPADRPDINSATPAVSGSLSGGNGWQTVTFTSPQKGRYIVIEITSVHDGSGIAAIAELHLQDSNGQRLSRESWTVKYADTEDESGNHTLDKVYDLQESTYWQSEHSAKLPHLLVIDLGSEHTVTSLEYLPRAEQGAPGSIKDYRIYFY